MVSLARPNVRILIVEDEDLQRRALQRLLTAQGYAVTSVSNSADAVAVVAVNDIAVAIVDLGLPDSEGLAIVLDMARHAPQTQCIVLTGEHGHPEQARALGAADYFEKPIADLRRFYQVIRRSVEVHRLQVRLANGPMGPIDPVVIGDSEAAVQLRASIAKAAGSTAPTLITGEPGSGKALVARAIHHASGRTGTLVTLNCAAVAAPRLDTELFGANAQDGGGVMGAAAQGTLVLDQVDALPPELQPKLTGALRRGRYRSTGSDLEWDISARVIASTSKDLGRLVRAGPFDAELEMTLSALTVKVPSLRERREDIPLLVNHFMRTMAAAEGLEPPRVPDDVLEALAARPWPSNVRELSHAVLRALMFGRGDSVSLADFGLAQRGPAGLLAGSGSSASWEPLFSLPLADARSHAGDLFLRAYLQRLLHEHHGNVTRAARAAGIHRPNLYREFRRVGIKVSDESL